MIYYLNSVGGSDSNFKPLFDNGKWFLDDFTINPSTQAPYGYEVNDYGYIVGLGENKSSRDSGFVMLPNETMYKYGIIITLVSDNGRAQYGRCQRNADAYICQQSGTGRISYHDISNTSDFNMYSEITGMSEGEFIAFGAGVSIKSIYYYPFL